MNRRQKKKQQKQIAYQKQKPVKAAPIEKMPKASKPQPKAVKPQPTAVKPQPTAVKPQPQQQTTAKTKSTSVSASNKKNYNTISPWELVFFPLTILYMEMVLSFSTKGNFLSHYGIYIMLFSIGMGGIFLSISHVFSKQKHQKIVQGVLLGVLSAFYFFMYFLYCIFQVFYDFNTLTAGAKGAILDFGGDGFYLLFSFQGISHLILFFLPLGLWFFLEKKGKTAWKKNTFSWRRTGLAGGIIYILAFLLILGNKNDRGFLSSAYNYQTAVADFGLITGVGLDIKSAVFAKSEPVTFEIEAESDLVVGEEQKEEVPVLETQVSEDISEDLVDAETTEEPILQETNQFPMYFETEKNQMEFDWAALSQKGGGDFTALDQYVQSQEASCKNSMTGLFKGKNLIFLTAEAFSAEVIDENRTPTLYRMATKGIQFTDYYQPSSAGTTGGEYANLFGMLPGLGGKSIRETETHNNWITMASRLTEEGYYGKAYHNNSYTFYDRHKTHINLGYSDGYMGNGNGLESVLSPVWPQSDLEMLEGTFPTYVEKQPFNIYYMTVSGHSLYTYEKNAMARKNWDVVKDLPYSDPIKVYLGAQQELENAMAYLLETLEKEGIANDTVVVISTDHFPYGLDQDNEESKNLSELYGYPITNDWERDHNRLILWSGCLEEKEPIVVDTPTTSMDILPTLCNLFGVEFDSRLLPGRDVFSDRLPVAFTLGYAWKTELGTYMPGKGFQKKTEDTVIPEGYEKGIHNLVKNKIAYTKGVLQQDYFRHLFEN